MTTSDPSVTVCDLEDEDVVVVEDCCVVSMFVPLKTTVRMLLNDSSSTSCYLGWSPLYSSWLIPSDWDASTLFLVIILSVIIGCCGPR